MLYDASFGLIDKKIIDFAVEFFLSVLELSVAFLFLAHLVHAVDDALGH